MGINLLKAFSERRFKSGGWVDLWSLKHFQKPLKTAFLATLSIFTVSCSAPVESAGNPCEVRVYHQQVLLAFSNNTSILKSGGVPSVAGNSIILQHFIWNDLWLVKDYVRVKQHHPFSEPKTTDYDKISADTTFLIVGVDDPLTFKFEGKKYFDGDYSDLGLDTACPIFTGRRNGKFAMATIRTLGGRHDEQDRRQRCDIYATLAFFGISKEDLKNYADYAEVDIFGPKYDRYAIRDYLETRKSCGGDSLKNLRIAAENGSADAQYKLGGIYASGGDGIVRMDDVQALKWLRMAANQGYANAQADLGSIYDLGGMGVDKNNVTAVKWYRLAAKQGNTNAQLNLGKMYAEGKGVKKNYVRSYLWISISEADEDRHTAGMIKSLGARMSEEQIAQAQSLASKCVESNYQDCG